MPPKKKQKTGASEAAPPSKKRVRITDEINHSEEELKGFRLDKLRALFCLRHGFQTKERDKRALVKNIMLDDFQPRISLQEAEANRRQELMNEVLYKEEDDALTIYWAKEERNRNQENE